MEKNISIYFIRHGQTDLNKQHVIQGLLNIPLNDTGRSQAHETGVYLKKSNLKFDCIYSSPLDRAYETAQIISSYIGYNGEIIKEKAFIERDFGELEGKEVTKENFEPILNDTCPTCEKNNAIRKRVRDGALKIIKDNPTASKFLIICHSHTIKAMLSSVDENISFYSQMHNCSVNEFIYENGTFTIKQYNTNPFEK